MRDHALLQAIARVNRPYEEEGEVRKPSGFVLDFVGIFDRLEKALAFDSDVVSGVIENLDVLKERFAMLMSEEADGYLALARGKIDDKAVERIIDTFTDKEAREEFSKFFKEIETLYEILSPDSYLGDYIERYQQLAAIFGIVRAAFGMGGSPIKDLMKKTEELVRAHVEATGLNEVLPVYQINEETLEALKKEGGSDSAKVVNLARSVATAVKQEEDKQPHLLPIGERAAHILALFEDRQLDTVQALRELQKAIEEFNAARREMKERGFDIETFSVYWVLRRNGLDEKVGVAVAPGIQEAFGRFANFRQNAEERRELTAELYRLLLPHTKKASRARGLVEELLRVRRR
jgi:type I restriction enzyme R subunit